MKNNYAPLLLVFFLVCFQGSCISQETLKTSVYFETGSFKVSQEEIRKLKKFKKEFGVNYKITAVLVNGYTDDLGSIESNNKLSQNRALEVKDQLGRLDFQISRNDRTFGLGPIPLASNNISVDEQRKQNRRVDISITYEKVVPPVMEPIVQLPPAIEEMAIEVKKLDNSLKVGDKVLMKNLIFVGGRDVLRNEKNPDIDSLVKFMQDNPKHKIAILGHVCCVDTGQDGFNTETQTRTLSIDRARKIYDLLAERGVSKNRMSYRGLKALYPTGLGEVADRRVEIQISSIEE